MNVVKECQSLALALLVSKKSSYDHSRAHFDEKMSFLEIYLHLLCHEHPLLASLEDDGAQKLSSFMNGTL